MVDAVLFVAGVVVCIDGALIMRGMLLRRRRRRAVFYGTTGQGMGHRLRQLRH